MGELTQHPVSPDTQRLAKAVGTRAPGPPPSNNAGERSVSKDGRELTFDVFPTCQELLTLKDETKPAESSGLKKFFGSHVVLQVDQYALRHKSGYIKIEDGKVAYVYPIRTGNVYVITAQGEKEQLVQWKENFRYCLLGSLIFRPENDPVDYIMFTFRKKE